MLRRPAAAVLRRPAAAAPVAVPAPVVAEQPGQFAWPHLLAWAKLLELGPETLKDSTGQYVYLVTLSRVLASTLDAAPHLCDPSGWSRQQVLDAVWDAMENPCVTTRGGRPRDAEQGGIILKEIVVREKHTDEGYHFHVGLHLRTKQRFLAAKRTLLERHRLASHWSSSHTQW